jgi:hypothetical protein
MKSINSYILERLVLSKTNSDNYVESIINGLLDDKTNKDSFIELTNYAINTFEKIYDWRRDLMSSTNYNELHYLIIQDVLMERGDGKVPKRIVNCGTKIGLDKYNNNRILAIDPSSKQQNYLRSILTIYDNDQFGIDDMIYLGSSTTNKILTTDIFLVDNEFVDSFKKCIYNFERKN